MSSRLRVAMDARTLTTGIGTYTSELLKGLHERGVAVHAITKNQYAAQVGKYVERLSICDAPMYGAAEQWEIPKVARGEDLLHVPHYNAPLLWRKKLVVTIHDLTHLLAPNFRGSWKSRLYARPMLMAVAKKADHIFTVSHYSKARIVEMLRVAEAKVSVAYCGVKDVFKAGDAGAGRREVQENWGIASPYVLYVGSLKPHKNIPTLLRAMQNLDATLVLAGDDRDAAQEVRRLGEELGLRLTHIPNASDEDLVQMYRGATVSVLPSFEEGFGLPVVEAMACGTPVICSRAASLPEVGGDAALYFDPRDAEELSRCLQRVLSDAELRAAMSEKGRERAGEFSWDKSVDQHVAVYESVLG